MSLADKQAALVEEITLIPDAYERLGHIVELGKQAAGLPDDLRIDSFKIEGCMSQLWVVPEFRDGLCYFQSESDSAIVKGIASLLCDFYSAAQPTEILQEDASFLGQVGITQHLSPNRRNGLSRIVESIQRFAQSCVANSETSPLHTFISHGATEPQGPETHAIQPHTCRCCWVPWCLVGYPTMRNPLFEPLREWVLQLVGARARKSLHAVLACRCQSAVRRWQPPHSGFR